MSSNQCKSPTKKGLPCKNKTMIGSEYCNMHKSNVGQSTGLTVISSPVTDTRSKQTPILAETKLTFNQQPKKGFVGELLYNNCPQKIKTNTPIPSELLSDQLKVIDLKFLLKHKEEPYNDFINNYINKWPMSKPENMNKIYKINDIIINLHGDLGFVKLHNNGGFTVGQLLYEIAQVLPDHLLDIYLGNNFYSALVFDKDEKYYSFAKQGKFGKWSLGPEQ
jgi:hypothetical protein